MQSPISAAADTVLGIARRGHARKVLFWILGLVAAFALIGFFVVPPIAKPRLEEALSTALHRPVTIEALRVNPFAPSVTVRGFVVQERSGAATFLTFDELYINVGWSSIFRLAPVVDAAKLVKPSAHVIRESEGTYNFQDLVDGFMARPRNDEPPPKFAAFNLQLVDGRIDVDDRAKGEKHEVTDLRIGIPFISSLPSHVDVTVVPGAQRAHQRGTCRRQGRDAAIPGHASHHAERRIGEIRSHPPRRLSALRAARQSEVGSARHAPGCRIRAARGCTPDHGARLGFGDPVQYPRPRGPSTGGLSTDYCRDQ